MKKSVTLIILALAVSASAFAQDAAKKTFGDVFQASIKGGVSLPFASTIYLPSHGMTQSYQMDMSVNPQFDITVAAKLGDYVSLGLGYLNSGASFAKQGLVGVDTPVFIADEAGEYHEYVNTDYYPTKYGTYNCLYGQLGISFVKWSKYQRVRPILYARVGASQKTDYSLISRPSYTAGTYYSSMQQFQNDVTERFKYQDTVQDNSWCIYSAIGLMLSINVWDKLSVLVDVYENQFIFTANQKVDGYYYSKSGILHAESLQINGWFGANIGLAWNF